MAKNIMVIFGGVSTEYLISLRSAYNIISGLREAGHNVCCAGITRAGDWLPYKGPDEAILEDKWQEIAEGDYTAAGAGELPRSPGDWLERLCGCRPDCVFPAVHGINCEDGTLQGLLTLAGIPFVGSGVLGSAACMDKLHAKKIFRDAGIGQCGFISVSRSEIGKNIEEITQNIETLIGFPCFLKPSNGGSSIGTCRVAAAEDLPAALEMAGIYDRDIVIEEFVRGRELEVAVMGNETPVAGEVGEIITSGQVEYYDYEAKYFLEDAAEVKLPADIDPATAEKIKNTAIQAYKAIGCTGLARVDFFLDSSNNRLMINEINTLPGFTPISVFPKSFAAAGVALPELVDNLCQLAIDEHLARKRQEII